MIRRGLLIFALCLVCFSCKKDPSPRPVGYIRIDEQKDSFVTYNTRELSFEVSSKAIVLSEKKGTEDWITIRYPHYGTYLYCTYLPVTRQNVRFAMEDSYRMAFSHTVKANGIAQQSLGLAAQKSGGILYRIGGNVATPRQFFVTDSTAHFFRASLYFNGKVQQDSLEPVIQYMDKHIDRLIHSICWK